MNTKEARFMAEYLIDGNATRAAIRAGYSKRSASQLGYRLLRKDHIGKAIAAARAQVAKKAEVTARGVLSDVQRVFELAVQAGQYSAALKAQDLLGRHLGMWGTPEGQWRVAPQQSDASAEGPSDIVIARQIMYLLHRVMARQRNGADPAPSLLGVEQQSRHWED
jgi:phage terminase small subunit